MVKENSLLKSEIFYWIISLLIFPVSLGILLGCFGSLYSGSLFFLSLIYSVLFLTLTPFIYWNYNVLEDRSHKKQINVPLKPLDNIINRNEITESDKFVIQHLFDRHNNQLSFVDALDTKYSQIIAINVVILSFIFDKMKDAHLQGLFVMGIFIIFSSILIGILGYACRDLYVGASKLFFMNYSTISPKKGLNELLEQLIRDIDRNKKIQNIRANIFNITLIINIIGLLIVILGYYVT
ncbi:hypothetical protein [uncultured Methanospirillum sp.]|uniref:hypothetical protein n=1 Tax=uncultured Methanospirillum sp. TaxID=262503 RepID=UPI0029C8F3CC|nr:hypothetical protein [uncultured Methanospirillum sp.]